MEKSTQKENLTQVVINPFNGKMLNMMPLIEEIHDLHEDNTDSMAEQILGIIEHISYNLPDDTDPVEMANKFHFLYQLRGAFTKMEYCVDESLLPSKKDADGVLVMSVNI